MEIVFYLLKKLIMPHFSNHMSHHEIADALHHAHLTSRALNSQEFECISKSLENPLTVKLMELHPLPPTSKKVIDATIDQIRARNPQQQNNPVVLGVHGIIYGGEREKTAAYLKKNYPPTGRADLMETFRQLVREAVWENAEVQKELEISENDRYAIRMKENISTPVYSLQEIQSDFLDYLNHLEELKRAGSTFEWESLESLIQHYEATKSPEEKQAALFSLIRAVDDARTAYHASQVKYVAGKDYSCSKGLMERLLDHHQFLRPVESKGPATPIEETILALTGPFLSHDAAQEGCRATFSPALYQMYCDAAGYQIITPELIEIYALVENVQGTDAQLEAQYLSSLETSSPLSAQKKIHHQNQFRSLLGGIRQKSVLVSAQSTSALAFLVTQGRVTITSYQPEETLQLVGPEKTEAEIFEEMLRRYPCFLGAAHLKLILTLHNLYGRFDGDFETYASLETLKKVAESELIPDSTAAIDTDSIIAAYSQYVSSQEVPFYDFYDDQDQLTAQLTTILHQWPCSEDVLLQWLQNPESRVSLEQAQKLAVLAAKTGYKNALRVLLHSPYSVSPNYECPQEWVPLLILAAQYGRTETVKALIAAGAKVNLAAFYCKTALIEAAKYGHTETVKALIANGANVNLADYNGYTALMCAAMFGRTETVQALIAAGAKVNLTDKHRRTALMWAAGYTETVKALIAARACVDCIDKYGCRASNLTVSTDIKKILLKAQYDINNTNQFGRTVLIRAITGEINSNSLKKIFDYDRSKMKALETVKDWWSTAEIVQAIIDAGADVNIADQDGKTALMYAAAKGYTETVKVLIAAGADLNIADQDGKTALMLTQKKSIDIVNALTAPSVVDRFKQTAFHQILENAHTEGYIPAKGMPQTQGELQQLILDLFGVIWDKNIPQFTSESSANLEIETFKKQMTFLSYSYADEIYNDPQKKENATWYIEQFDEMLRKKFESSFRYQNPQSLHLYSHLRGTWTGLFYTCARWLFNFFRDKKGLDGNDVKKFDQFIAEQLIQTQKDVNANTLGQQEEKESQTQEIREIAMGLDAQQYSKIVWEGCSGEEKTTWNFNRQLIQKIIISKDSSQGDEKYEFFQISGLDEIFNMLIQMNKQSEDIFIKVLYPFINLSSKHSQAHPQSHLKKEQLANVQPVSEDDHQEKNNHCTPYQIIHALREMNRKLKSAELPHEERAFAIDLYQHLYQKIEELCKNEPELRKRSKLDEPFQEQSEQSKRTLKCLPIASMLKPETDSNKKMNNKI